jgi:hypothetical protein
MELQNQSLVLSLLIQNSLVLLGKGELRDNKTNIDRVYGTLNNCHPRPESQFSLIKNDSYLT